MSSQGGSSGPKDDSTLTVPGARNSFFFGADNAGKVKPKHKQHEMAKTMGKPDDGVGAASHSGSTGGNNVGRNARRNLVGGARNGGGRKEVLDYDGGLALQDVEVRAVLPCGLDYWKSCGVKRCSVLPRIRERGLCRG